MLMAVMLGGLVGVTAVAAGEQFIPILGVREGALRFLQIPFANGFIDYVTLLNARDGGINGVPLVWEECETVYDVTRGIECYERLKGKGPTGAAVFQLANAPLVTALLERATHDRIPLLPAAGGRGDAADGRVFRDRMVGPLPTCAEQNMILAGEAASGFICASWHGMGRNFPLIQEMLQYVYAQGKGAGPEEDVGTSNWIWGMLRALLITEAIRTAMRHFGHQPLTGAQVQWGLEHLTLTAAYLKEMGRRAYSLRSPCRAEIMRGVEG
jgi:hypothetical protein